MARVNQEIKNTYGITGSDIFVENLDSHIITNVFHIDVKSLVPLGGLAGTLESTSPELLLSCLDHGVGVHLTEELSVSGKACLNNLKAKVS